MLYGNYADDDMGKIISNGKKTGYVVIPSGMNPGNLAVAVLWTIAMAVALIALIVLPAEVFGSSVGYFSSAVMPKDCCSRVLDLKLVIS